MSNDMRFRVHARLLHEGIGGIEMTAKQTPLVDILRLHAEDLHSDYGHNKSARLLSQAADEIERLRSNSLALEDEKNDYMDGVGDVLRQDHDGETLWAAAQRVMSECDRLRAELAECREFYAVTAWNHYMETCKKRRVSPAEHGHWSSAGAIRKAARKGEEEVC